MTYRRARRELSESGRVYRYDYSAMLHEFCALTGNPYQGLQDMRLRVRGFYTLNRPYGKMQYAASLAVLCRYLTAVGAGGRAVPGTGPGHEVVIGVLAGEAWHIAMDLAARFDQRNQNSWQGNRIRARLAAAPAVNWLPLVSPEQAHRTGAAASRGRGYRPWWWPR